MSVMETLQLMLQTAIADGRVNVSQLAREVGCSRQHIYDISNGIRKPKLEHMERLARHFGCEIKLVPQKHFEKVSA